MNGWNTRGTAHGGMRREVYLESLMELASEWTGYGHVAMVLCLLLSQSFYGELMPILESLKGDRIMDRGMTCDDCRLTGTLLINCEGCIQVVCRSCYEHEHSGHRESSG